MGKNEQTSEYEYYKVPIKDGIPEQEPTPAKYGYGVRHIQVIIFFTCLTVNIIARGHIGVTIVAMTSQPDDDLAVNNSVHSIVNDSGILNDALELSNLEEGLAANVSLARKILLNTTEKRHTYEWPKYVQEMVLSAFFFGYMIMMLPMGMVCQRYGGKLPLQLGLFINALASFIAPWLTTWGDWKAVCACRILQGLAQTGTYPGLSSLLAKWVPVNERAALSSFVYSGMTIGTIIAYQLAGFLGASKWGWPSTFYTVGAICLVCFIILTVFGAASPLDHKTITEAERNYINGTIGQMKARKVKTPWRSIFTSKPLWGTIITHVGSTITFVFYFNQVPSYIHHILGMNVKNSGILSSLPYIASIFSNALLGWASDYFTNKNYISLNNSRRICNSIAQFGMAFCLIFTSYSTNTAVAVTYLVLAMSCNMGAHTGWMINHIDLSPNFAGTLMSLGSSIANVFIVLSPIVVSHIVTDMSNVYQWRIMFYIMAGVSLTCNSVFMVMMTTDVQPWNNCDDSDDDLGITKEADTNEKKEKQ